MTGFHGCFTRGGAFVAHDGPFRRAESHLGCAILVRGYVADRAKLVERLGIRRTAGRVTDGELLAHAFRRWGDELQAHVPGEYAAAIWDPHERAGLLTHDALGLERLFYADRADGLAFATELIDLIDLETSGLVDDEYLADFLALGLITNERTPYRSVRRLLPGQSVRWSDGTASARRTWNLADAPSVRCKDDGEYEERFRALLEAGVRSALDSVENAGVSLSGGLDSSSIACVAARFGRKLNAYSTICPRWPDADEQPWMQEVVRDLGLPWYPDDVETAMPFAVLPTEFLGEPTRAVAGELRRAIQRERLAAHGVTVLLSGHGGDTVLGARSGMLPRHLADPLFLGDPVGALRSMSAWRRGARDGRSFTFWLQRALLRPAIEHAGANRITAEIVEGPWWLAPGYARSANVARRSRGSIAPRCRTPGRQFVWDDLWVASTMLCGVPRSGAAFELRKPLMYLPLVEFMAGIPWEQKLQPRCDRSLQRRALDGILTESVRRRTGKTSGSAPFTEGLRRSPAWIAYLSDSPAMAERGMVDREQWRRAVREASVGQTHGDKAFFSGVAVEVWLKQLGEHRARLASAPAVPLAV
jgi:asparagine synthase (glutamine-hydrolysing)